MNSWAGRRMCRGCLPLLAAQGEGKIHSVFHHALNFVVDQQMYTVVSRELGLSPYSIVLGEGVDFTLVAKRGDSIFANSGALTFSGCRVDLKAAALINLSLDGAVKLDSSAMPKSFLLAVGEEIGAYPHAGDGIAPLISLLFSDSGIRLPSNPLTTFLAPKIEKVMDSVASCHMAEAVENLSTIAGAGVGLTPSSDDFIVGIIGGLYRSAYVGEMEYALAKELADGIFRGAKEKTVEISAHYIGVASTGFFSENLLELITTDFSVIKLNEFRENLKKILNYGASSGSDVLTGYYFGLRMMGKPSE